jgi:glycosyltransferase involved in cell wall biosynthesis
LLSVVMPTHNRRAQALRAVRAIAAAGHPGDDLEVIVVCDGSTDGTAAALREATWPFPLAVLEQPQSGQAAARNRGAAAAHGDILVFLDDDMVPHAEFLREVRTCIVRGADYILTRVRLGPWVADTLLSREFKRWTSSPPPPADAPLRNDELLFSANAVRRCSFENAGRFDESFTRDGGYGNEDVELGVRLRRSGAIIARCDRAVADTEPILDAPRVLERERLTGRNDVRLVRRYPELASEVFGHKLKTARSHRIVASAVLATPWVSVLIRPLRAIVLGMIRLGVVSAPLATAWSCCRAVEYWRGVVDAGGRDVVNALRTRGA